jgi:hypothetical protein
MPEICEATGAATEPAEVASGGAPAIAEEKNDELLSDASLEVVVRFTGDSGRGADPFGANVWGRHE